MSTEMWLWEVPRASEQTDVRVTEAREEAVAETAIDVTHAVIGTLQMLMTPFVHLEGISTVVVGVPELVQDRLTVIGTIGPEVGLGATTMIESGTEAHAATVLPGDDGHLVLKPKSPHPNQLRMSVIGGLSLCSNLLLD
jgi:hypothetical protein